jgi:hypothetical protein
VLAAAMIFAMVMTVSISTSSAAVFHIGASVRRLEASMLADRILADLEIEMKQGIAPESTDEFEQDPYTIRIGRIDLTQDIGAHDPNNEESIIVSTLGAELPEVLNHLGRYDIEVSWMEQSGPQSVTRISFAFDWQNARTEFSTLFTPSTPSDADGDVSDENGTEKNQAGHRMGFSTSTDKRDRRCLSGHENKTSQPVPSSSAFTTALSSEARPESASAASTQA